MSQNLIPPVPIFNNVSLAASVNSAGVHIIYTDNVGIQFVWTGTPTGTFGVDVSNSAVLNQDGSVSGGTWDSLTLSPAISAAGSAGHAFLDLNQLGAAFIRATYTRVGGTGSCTATLTAKPV